MIAIPKSALSSSSELLKELIIPLRISSASCIRCCCKRWASIDRYGNTTTTKVVLCSSCAADRSSTFVVRGLPLLSMDYSSRKFYGAIADVGASVYCSCVERALIYENRTVDGVPF